MSQTNFRGTLQLGYLRQTILDLKKEHTRWCKHLDKFAVSVNVVVPSPSMLVYAGAHSWAGQYHRDPHRCIYSLPYALLYSDYADEVVAHEVCHAFAKCIEPTSDWHGEFFKFLIRRVCNFPNHKPSHDYSIPKAKGLGVFLRLQVQIHPIEGLVLDHKPRKKKSKS